MYRALLVLLALGAPSALAQRTPTAPPADGAAFIENRGQWPAEVLFLARTGGADVWVTADAVVFDYYEVERAAPDPDAARHEGSGSERRRGHVVAMRFEGGHARRAVGQGLREGYHNYFLGGDPAGWASRAPLYDGVTLEGLYDGVDLRLYADGGRLRYDLTLAPGVDPAQVRVRVEGAEGASFSDEGVLRIETALGPVEYQGLAAPPGGTPPGGPDARRSALEEGFAVRASGTVDFRAIGAAPVQPLASTPLVWSTYLGSTGTDGAYGTAAGPDGSVTVAGRTNSPAFPATTGAYDVSHNGVYDAFVSRLSSDGSALVFSTFLGGTWHDRAYAVAVGPDGSVTVVGETSGDGFPGTAGAFDPSHNGSDDAFAARLSADGSTLLYSTYLGGSSYDRAYAVAVGLDGSATVVGETNNDDFPVTPGAFDTSNPSFYDAFVTRLAPDGSSLTYSTYLGGARSDGASGVDLGADGSATVVGTGSEDFPVTPGAFDTSGPGGFVARLSADGSSLLYSTFLDGATDVAGVDVVDADGSATVVGTAGEGFPVTPGAFDTSHNGGFSYAGGDAFAARLSGDGAALLFSTFLGGVFNDYGAAVAVGGDGRVTVVGSTYSADFPSTPGAFDPSFNGYGSTADAFVAQLSADGAVLLYGTFLGGTGYDAAPTFALGADGDAIVAGTTYSTDFPTTSGSLDPTYNVAGDGFVARLRLDLPAYLFSASALDSEVPRGGTLRLQVSMANNTSATFSGDLALDVESQGGVTTTRTLATGVTLAPGQASAPTFALRVPLQAPLGLYAGMVTALGGGTAVLAEAPFAFRVIEQTGDAAENGAPWAVTLLDAGGLAGSAATARQLEPQGTAVWPNPASGRATLAFVLEDAAEIRLAVYDVLGREVMDVEAGVFGGGSHRLPLDLSRLPAGPYVWRLRSGERVEGGRLTVVR